MTKTRSVSAITVAACLVVGLSACGSFDDGGSTGATNENLVISLQFTPRANFALETDDAFVLTQVGCLESLLTYDQDAGELKPMLATEWTQSTPTTWDFTLREGVRFQDGADLTADAAVAALNHVLTAETPPRAFTPKVVSRSRRSTRAPCGLPHRNPAPCYRSAWPASTPASSPPPPTPTA
jgi:peptide/nickel transport system substrate-binding protein